MVAHSLDVADRVEHVADHHMLILGERKIAELDEILGNEFFHIVDGFLHLIDLVDLLFII